MRRRLRQAGQVASHAGHHGARLVGTLVLVLLLLFGAASWRLARGPVDLPPLASRIASATAQALPGSTVTIGRAALAWEGFHHGGAPLDLRLSDIVLSGPTRAVALKISNLRVTLSPLALLHGKIAPVRIAASHTTIALRPDRAGATPMQLRDDLLAALTEKTGAQGIDFTDLRSVHIGGARLTLAAPAEHLDLAAENSHFDLIRVADGTLAGAGGATLRHGTATAPLAVEVRAADGAGRLRLALGPGDPASLEPDNADAARFDLPVTLTIVKPLGTAASAVTATIATGPGTVAFGQGNVPVAHASFAVTFDGSHLTLTEGRIALARHANSAPVIGLTGRIALAPPFAGSLHATVDKVAAAALPAFWPPALAHNARAYVVKHIPAGTGSDGDFTAHFHLGANPDLGSLTGHFAASGVTLDWIPGAPPLTDLGGVMTFPDKDTLVATGVSGKLGGVTLHGGMRITGLNHHDQTADITAKLDSPVAAIPPLLDAPPLRLSRQGIDLTGATGQATGTIHATVPLIKNLTLNDVGLTADAHFTALHMPLPVARLALDDGAASLTASLKHLAFRGSGLLAGQETHFSAAMALPDGKFKLNATTLAGPDLFAALGQSPNDRASKFWRNGTAPLTIAYDVAAGHGTLDLSADLTPADLALPMLGWAKPAGEPGRATIRVGLDQGKPTRLDTMAIDAPGLTLDGTWQGDHMRIGAARIGDTVATGRLTPPRAQGQPWLVALTGPLLDLSAVLRHVRASETAPAQPRPPNPAPAKTPPSGLSLRLTAAFDALRLHAAPSPPLGPVHIAAVTNAGELASLTATARTGPKTDARLTVADTNGTTRISLVSGNAGALLAATGATADIANGTLDLTATDTGGTTGGRMTLDDFRLRHAPVMAKVLQGLTLYGVPAATSGPGLAFTRLIAPFSLAGSVVTLHGVRAYSPSLGFTATGSIDLAHQSYDLGGTIVPAYALNTLPGRIPIIGRLFSPEKGSGLFAARFTVTGPLASPHVMVNPLSAIAPGFLRDIFGFGPPEKPPSHPVSRQP
ncbi:MAG TPA: AsmA-like C-terminal region-containing protein [Acidiphilium sp.]